MTALRNSFHFAATDADLQLFLQSLGEISAGPEFRQRGIEATRLRNPAEKKQKFLGREESVASLQNEILHAGFEASKMPIITVPGGPGQGKTELVARIIEGWDTPASAYNDHVRKVGHGVLLPVGDDCLVCGVSFDYETRITWEEREIFGGLSIEIAYQLLISFRLIYTWLIKKDNYSQYHMFVTAALDLIDREEMCLSSFLLEQVLRLLEQRSACKFCVLFIDGSLCPLTELFQLDVTLQGALFNTIAVHQTLQRVIVFTTVDMAPFRAIPARTIQEILLRRLSLEESVQLIQDMASINVESLQSATQRTALQVLAWWAGGSPLFCRQAAVALMTQEPLINPVLAMDQVYNWVRSTYMHKIQIPQIALLLAVLGAVLPSYFFCKYRDLSGYVDLNICFARGILSRDADGRIFLQPILLRLFCDQYDPVQPCLPASSAAAASVTTVPVEDAKQAERVPADPFPATASAALARQLRPFVTSLLSGGEGEKLKYFDRQRFRVLYAARVELEAAIRRGNVTFTRAESRYGVDASDIVTTLRTNWAKASLWDIFGRPRYSTLTKDMRIATFNVSALFHHREIEYRTIPSRDDPQWSIELLTGAQFYPETGNNDRSDWLQVLRRSGDDSGDKRSLLFVYTGFMIHALDAVSAKEDILRKEEQVTDMLAEAGWVNQPFVLRMVTSGGCPSFQKSTLDLLPENVLVYGPEEMEADMSPTLLDIFTGLRELDALK